MIEERDREQYEEGRRDRDKGSVDQFIIDITESHPDTEAYYKGRRGEQFDGDKKE